MASTIATNMLRKRQASPPLDAMESHAPDGDTTGHPHHEGDHTSIDRQHAFDSAMEGLHSLAKDGMPGAEEIVKQLEKGWASWQGSGQPMQPTTKASHRASPVSKSGIDEADEESIYQPDSYDASKE